MRKIADTFIYALLGIPATWLGACLPCMILSGALGIDFPKEILAITAVLSVALWCGIQTLSKGWIRVTLRLFPILLAAGLCLVNRSETMEGIRGIAGVLIDISNDYFGWSLRISGEASLATHELTLAWLVPSMLLLTLAQMAAEGIAPLCWINMSVFAPAVVVALNEFPAIWLLCLYIGLALYFVVAKDSFVLPMREGNRMRLRFAVILMLIILPTSRIISGSFYDKHIRDWKVRIELREKLWEKMPYLFNTDNGDGNDGYGRAPGSMHTGMSGGLLPLNGNVASTGEKRLRVTLPEGLDAVYLRGEAFGEYDGTRWKIGTRHMFQLSDIDSRGGGRMNVSQLSGLAGAYFMDQYPEMAEVRFPINRGIMTIEVLDADETCVFTPYDTMDTYPANDTSVLFSHNSEGCVTAPNPYVNKYSCVFVYNTYGLPHFASYTQNFLAPVAPYADDETYLEMLSLYDEYVYDNYLTIPEQCAGVRGLIPLNAGNNVLSAVAAVEEYLADYDYTLSPGAVPADEDFIMYFLKKRKAGFCVHFASAGVMLFRSLGIPARLAEGYIIMPGEVSEGYSGGTAPVETRGAGPKKSGPVPMKTVDVFDKNAHAWVEIYIKGYGWYPIEVTYGDTVAALSAIGQIAGKPVATVTPTGAAAATPTPAGTSPTPTSIITLPLLPTQIPGLSPTVTPKPSGTPKPTDSITPTPGEGKTRTAAKSDDDDHFWAVVGLTLLCIGVIVGCLYMRRAYVRTKRRSKTFGTSPKHAVIAVCRDMGYLFRLTGIRMAPGETERAYCSRAAETLGHGEELGWLHDIGNRACFGGQTITREDRRRAVRLYRSVRATVLRGRSVVTRFAWVFLRGV